MEKIAFEDYNIVFNNFDNDLRKVVITDQNIYDLQLHNMLNLSNVIDIIVIPPGEVQKNLETVSLIINKLLELEITRSDMLVALGGGVIGDICGFVASIYKRGIKYLQVPTTLLAMVDSSIGGKTGVNVNMLKNCVGSFYNPEAVIINLEFLKTLDKRNFNNGMYEVIKCGIIKDKSIIDDLENDFDLKSVIKKAINVKKYYVENDCFEKGIRKTLNFGHTLGHAIETYYNGEVLHGEAVAVGMLKMLEEDSIRIEKLYEKFNFKILNYNIDDVFKYITNDKKRVDNDKIELVFASKIGESYIKEMTYEDLYLLLKE